MTPLVKDPSIKNKDRVIAAVARTQAISTDEARAMIEKEITDTEVWVNEKYQVSTRRFDHKHLGPCMSINIRRHDGGVIFRDWRDFQAIKNQLAGPECEGLELYPAESRKVDATNKYHIFCILNPEERIPFGWQERDVREPEPESGKLPGMRQRPLPPSDPEARTNNRHKGTK